MSGEMLPLIPRRVWWASKRFEKPGVYIWVFKKNVRIIPVPKRFLPGRGW